MGTICLLMVDSHSFTLQTKTCGCVDNLIYLLDYDILDCEDFDVFRAEGNQFVGAYVAKKYVEAKSTKYINYKAFLVLKALGFDFQSDFELRGNVAITGAINKKNPYEFKAIPGEIATFVANYYNVNIFPLLQQNGCEADSRKRKLPELIEKLEEENKKCLEPAHSKKKRALINALRVLEAVNEDYLDESVGAKIFETTLLHFNETT